MSEDSGSLFPEAWRERRADAQLRRRGPAAAAREQMSSTIGGALCCWIGFVVCGAGFAKLTEDHAFRAAAAAHPVIGVTRTLVAVVAVASIAVVVVGGGRLIVEVIGEAVSDRRGPLVRAVCAPFAAVVGFGSATVAVVALAGGGLVGHAGLAWIVFLVWCAIGVAAACVCGLACRAALRHAHPGVVALRRGVLGSAGLTAGLGLMTLLTFVYAAAIAFDAPSVGAQANGPFGLVSTTGGLTIVGVLMAGLTALAAVTSARGLHAVRSADGRA